MVNVRRNVGRPAMTEEQRAIKERTVDTHLNLPESIVNALEAQKKEGESRKDCIVRLLKERLGL